MTVKNNRIGLLGGTFDPPHIGHVKISIFAKKKFKLKKIIWAITKKNPFKLKSSNNLNSRIALAREITKNNPFIIVKYYEDKVKSNKTYRLIKYLKKNNKSSKLFFLMGADNLINFHKWYRWKDISLNCNIIVFDRDGYKLKSIRSVSYKLLKKRGLKFVKFDKVNISSSKLRNI